MHPHGMVGVSLARTSGSSTTSMATRPANSAPARISGLLNGGFEPMYCMIPSRWACRVAGSDRNSSICSAGCSWSSLGRIQLAERWKTCSCEATLASSGMHCTALAALPMTAMRFPSRSSDVSHRPVCSATPSNESRPSISGIDTSPNIPCALMSTSAVSSSPRSVTTVHVAASSFQDADATPVFRRIIGHRPSTSTVWRM